MWKIEDFDKVIHPEQYYGHFWSSDSYLILYEYKVLSTEKAVLYFWQGRETSVNERGTSAYLTKEMDDLLQGRGAQVRVVQYNERSHFLTIFSPFVIHRGHYVKEWEASDVKLFSAYQSYDKQIRCKEHIPVCFSYVPRPNLFSHIIESLKSS